MRKIIFACAFVFVGGVCHATEMCARNDTVIVPLEAANNGLSSGYNNNEFTWWVDFDFGRIYGYSTCLSADEGLGRTGTMGAYYGTGEYANAFINVDPGLTGTDANGNERKYCWCKMTHPASSRWVFLSATLRRPIASRIARTTAVPTSRLTPLCAGACLGRSASDVPSNIEYV